MSIILKATFQFKVLPIKTSMSFTKTQEKKILKFVCNFERPQIAKSVMRRKNKTGNITLTPFKLYYKAILIKTVIT